MQILPSVIAFILKVTLDANNIKDGFFLSLSLSSSSSSFSSNKKGGCCTPPVDTPEFLFLSHLVYRHRVGEEHRERCVSSNNNKQTRKISYNLRAVSRSRWGARLILTTAARNENSYLQQGSSSKVNYSLRDTRSINQQKGAANVEQSLWSD